MSSKGSAWEISAAPGELPAQAGRVPAKLIVVLPAYNEAPNLSPLLAGLGEAVSGAHLLCEVVLVDDGSSDGTADVLRECAARYHLTIIRHERNCGLAATLRDGLLEALQRADDTDIVVTMDADSSHTPDHITRMVDMIRSGCDVVVASRFQPGAEVHGVPAHRRLLSLGASYLCRVLFPTQGIRDFTCGYRAFRASALRRASQEYGPRLFETEGFSCVLDLLLKLRRLRVAFDEVPIRLRYDLKAGKSKMHVWRTIYGTFALLLRRRMGY